MRVSKKIVLRFPPNLVDKAITYHLVKDYDLEFNILKASVTPKEEGVLVMELSGERKKYDESIRYLTGSGVGVEPLIKDVVRKEDRCTYCGACVCVCPTGAFVVDTKTRRVNFVGDKCIACGLCLNTCPVRAMEVRL
ncbi:NIL domain-containing protein [Chloroflexota bacterium]